MRLGIKLFAAGLCGIIAGVIMAVMRIRSDTGTGVAALGILVAANGLVLAAIAALSSFVTRRKNGDKSEQDG
jgi:hypothetical protein